MQKCIYVPLKYNFFYENMMCVTAYSEILQHLNLNIFWCIDFFLSRNLKNDPPTFKFHH